MSLGSGYHDKNCDTTSALTEIIDRLRAKNIATVVAAGNEGFFDGISEPACISRAVSVAALDRDGKLDVTYSNVADFVTLAAPGTSIVSLTFKGGYTEKSGTSMAAPHVAAALALLHEQHPELTIKQQLERLASASHPVADPRTDTKVTAMDLASLAAPVVVAAAEPRETQPGEPATVARGVARAAAAPVARFDSHEFNRSLLTMVADGASYIVKTDKSEAEIAATLNEKCSNYQCDVRQVGNNAYKVDIAPKRTEGTRGVTPPVDVPDSKALEEIIGGNAKVYDNRLSRPQQPGK
jgi:subtilisin family serine protease